MIYSLHGELIHTEPTLLWWNAAESDMPVEPR